jgi:hypothetical protein
MIYQGGLISTLGKKMRGNVRLPLGNTPKKLLAREEPDTYGSEGLLAM